MNFMLKISLTNLTRRLYRSVVIVILIAIGVTGLMFLEGFFEGIMGNMKNDFIKNSGHLIVEHQDYKDSDLFDDRIENASSIVAKIHTLDTIKSLAPRLINEGLLATSSSSRFVRITGIDQEKERAFGDLDKYIIQGSYGFGDKEKRVMIGEKLAEDLELKVGKKLVITTQDSSGEIAALGARVEGILKTNNPLIDTLTVFIPLDRAQKLFGTPDALTNISIMVKDDTKMAETGEKIKSMISEPLKLYSWGEYLPMVVQIKTTYDSFGYIAYVIVFVIVAIGIFNIILISVLERLKEYGIMMAIGTPFRQIRLQVMLESLILSGIGAVLGVILGSFLLIYYGQVGITYGDASDSMAKWGMGLVIYTDWTIVYVIKAFIAVIIATVISVWIPVRILKKRNPMSVLHFS